MPRVLLMCLALAFASTWLGCGPDLEEEVDWAPEDDTGCEAEWEPEESP